MYSWAVLDLPTEETGHRWMLLRRNDSTHELAYYRCYAPELAPLPELVRVAGQRWRIEESFQAAKGQAGLDKLICHDRLPDVGGQRQPLAAISLAVHGDLTASPVHVLQPQRRELARPQSKPDQHRQDRQVAATYHRVLVSRGQQGSDLIGVQRLGQPGELPRGDRGHRGVQRCIDEPVDVQETQAATATRSASGTPTCHQPRGTAPARTR